jgi:hypothetical protein
MKFDSDHFCKIRNFVTRACDTKYPNACSDGDLKKDPFKCAQFYECALGGWVKKHCGTSYYDEELGYCNSRAEVISKRPECATCDNTIDTDALEAEDATHEAGTITNDQKYPDLSVFKTFGESQKDHVRFVKHHLVASDCSSAWEPSPHPFECHKYLNCQGADISIAPCPVGYTWKKTLIIMANQFGEDTVKLVLPASVIVEIQRIDISHSHLWKKLQEYLHVKKHALV